MLDVQKLLKSDLKNEATTNMKIQEVLNKLGTSARLLVRDYKLSTFSGLVKLHPTEGTYWLFCIHRNYFDS